PPHHPRPPTRRSSDLRKAKHRRVMAHRAVSDRMKGATLHTAGHHGGSRDAAVAQKRFRASQHLARGASSEGEQEQSLGRRSGGEDRKSTRLNSSHQII